MKHFHGAGQTGPFFEGWYLKHQNGRETVALIPGMSLDGSREGRAFLQIVTGEEVHQITYPLSEFRASPDKFWVRVGENYFTRRGAWLKVDRPGCQLRGKLTYGPFTPLDYDIMGPFALLPGMECNHGILSMDHWLSGGLCLNGRYHSFDRGQGYLEKDWGSSFPSRYLWSQCGDLPGGARVMLSVAAIPLGPLSFTGCISVVCHRGRQYRLATYLGGRAVQWGPEGGVIVQGKLRLEARLLQARAHPLLAPSLGRMERVIHESPACRVAYRFWEGERLLLSGESDQAGFEYADRAENR